MNLMRQLVFIIGFLMLLSGCQTGSNVTTDYDTNALFNQYRTFYWAEQKAKADPLVDPLVLSRIHKSLEIQLLLAGLDPIKPGQKPDLAVSYNVTQKDLPVRREPSTSVGIGRSSGSYGSSTGISIGYSFGSDSSAGESVITVDLIDAKTNETKWRGSKPVTLAGKSPDQITGIVDSAVTEILSFYPPN
jgi:hypothetical protein